MESPPSVPIVPAGTLYSTLHSPGGTSTGPWTGLLSALAGTLKGTQKKKKGGGGKRYWEHLKTSSFKWTLRQGGL